MPFGGELLGPVDVVAVVGVAAVDHDVARLHARRELSITVAPAKAAGTMTQAARGSVELGDEVVEVGRRR